MPSFSPSVSSSCRSFPALHLPAVQPVLRFQGERRTCLSERLLPEKRCRRSASVHHFPRPETALGKPRTRPPSSHDRERPPYGPFRMTTDAKLHNSGGKARLCARLSYGRSPDRERPDRMGQLFPAVGNPVPGRRESCSQPVGNPVPDGRELIRPYKQAYRAFVCFRFISYFCNGQKIRI